MEYVKQRKIPSCPVMVQDIKNAEIIFGPDLGSLKGKTVWPQPECVPTTHFNVPHAIMQQYKMVTLSIDVMKVNSIPFLMTISRHIKFGTASKLDTMKGSLLIKHLTTINKLYQMCEF